MICILIRGFLSVKTRLGEFMSSQGTNYPPGYYLAGFTVVRIPKSAVLSVKSCWLSEHIPFELHGLNAQLGLSFALYSEFLRGGSSRWYGYLRSLPSSVDLPVFWAYDQPSAHGRGGGSGIVGALTGNYDHDDPMLWLHGTEVLRRLNERNRKGLRLPEAIDLYYQDHVLPVLKRPDIRHLLEQEPALNGFRHAFGLVSSRAFLLDVYHGLAMTPIADVFNHVVENHVHIQSDFYVCSECGSLRECEHDDAHHDSTLKLNGETSDQDFFYEMVSNADIAPNEEIFNTYGEKLSNAELLIQYGFILDSNESDVVHFDLAEITSLFASTPNGAVNPLPFSTWRRRDGRISFQLWKLLLQLLVSRGNRTKATEHWSMLGSLSKEELIEAAVTQIHVERKLHGNGPDDQELESSNVHESLWTQVLLEMARVVVRLCETKKETIGHPVYVGQDFGEILDSVPVDRQRLRLAVSVAMSECSILDSCKFAWMDVIDVLTSDDDVIE
ncbi:hypothetical protein NP233_g392 [Leucocoprinus birnbaumii]|uniref:SET domain-containing protein n=1 Tax=Leucocoprinus birnbaumii TaxID=56174 RepID=A0AAD5W285_9AGAR|nr:hypothetical protein NP233_g392 [Leucocoprinus birnbaumii]